MGLLRGPKAFTSRLFRPDQNVTKVVTKTVTKTVKTGPKLPPVVFTKHSPFESHTDLARDAVRELLKHFNTSTQELSKIINTSTYIPKRGPKKNCRQPILDFKASVQVFMTPSYNINSWNNRANLAGRLLELYQNVRRYKEFKALLKEIKTS